jgi:hypothetical protein
MKKGIRKKKHFRKGVRGKIILKWILNEIRCEYMDCVQLA